MHKIFRLKTLILIFDALAIYLRYISFVDIEEIYIYIYAKYFHNDYSFRLSVE